MLLETQEGVPTPRPTRRAPDLKYPFQTMAVGGFFFVPHRSANNLTQYASARSKRLKRRFRTRMITMRETIEGWVPCGPDDEGAVQGIGCWRDE